MTYYAFLSVVPDSGTITFENFYTEDDYTVRSGLIEDKRKKLEGTWDHVDDSIWVYVEVEYDKLTGKIS